MPLGIPRAPIDYGAWERRKQIPGAEQYWLEKNPNRKYEPGWEAPPHKRHPEFYPPDPNEMGPNFHGGYNWRTELPKGWTSENWPKGKNPLNDNPIISEDPTNPAGPPKPQDRKLPGATLGSMEQYRLETIEMTDLGQSAEWAEEMQKAVEEDKLHEHHTADAAGMGGGAAPAYGGHRRGGRGGGESVDLGDSAAAAVQGKAGDIGAGAVTAVGGGPPKAFIMHHTGGRGTAAGVQETLRQRGLGVQYVMDRAGNITKIGGPGSRHIRPGTGLGAGLSNRNVVGMEVIAKNDADVTPAQVSAARKFIQKYYPRTPVYGHGEVNPGHKEASEGMTITRAIRGDRRTGRASGDDSGVTAGVKSAPGTPAPEPRPEHASIAQHRAEKDERRARNNMRRSLLRAANPIPQRNPMAGIRNPLLHKAFRALHRSERPSTPPPSHARQPMVEAASSIPYPISRHFGGIPGLPGSPSGSAPERPVKAHRTWPHRT
jgi:hypothetical protein